MPKVIFRPNPVPPPFTPPTPSYDTTSTIKFDSFPFISGADVGFELPSLNVPNYTEFIICQLNPDTGFYAAMSDMIGGDVSQPLVSSFTAENDSYNNDDFEVQFLNEDFQTIWTIKATRID